MTSYPTTLPLEAVLTVIEQVISGEIDKKYIAKAIWESIGYALHKFLGELGEVLVTGVKSVPVMAADLMNRAEAFGPGLKALLRTVITLLLTLAH